MANDNKRVSVTAITEACEKSHESQGGSDCMASNVIDWFGVKISVRRSLGLRECAEFVASVVNTILLAEGSKPCYYPEFFDFIVNTEIVTRYSNINLPKDANKAYDIVCRSGLTDLIKEYIDAVQLDSIITAASDRIDYICALRIAESEKSINDMLNEMNNFVDKAMKPFKSVSETDVKALIGAVLNGHIDEKKLVEAYLSHKKEDGSDIEVSVAQEATE